MTFLFIFLMLLCTGFMSCLLLPNMNIVTMSCAILFFLYGINIKNHYYELLNPLRLIAFSIFLGCIPAYFLFNQNLYGSFQGAHGLLLGLSLYFVLLRWQLPEKKIIKILLIFSLFYTFFEIVQQYTYPFYIFNGRVAFEQTGLLEKRIGLWRFYIYGVDYLMIVFVYYLQNIIERKNGKFCVNLLLTVILFVGIIFFCARKNIYGAISCFFFGILLGKGKNRQLFKVLTLILAFFAIYFLSNIMSDLNSQTNTDLTDDDFIRLVSARYFIYDFSDSPLYYLFGAGAPYAGKSELGLLVQKLGELYHIFQADCGFVGYFSMFGLFGLVAYIFLIIRIVRNWKYVDLYLKLYLIIRLELCFFDFWAMSMRGVAAFSIYCYLVECSIRRNKNFVKIRT